MQQYVGSADNDVVGLKVRQPCGSVPQLASHCPAKLINAVVEIGLDSVQLLEDKSDFFDLRTVSGGLCDL